MVRATSFLVSILSLGSLTLLPAAASETNLLIAEKIAGDQEISRSTVASPRQDSEISKQFARLSDTFIKESLYLSPTSASEAGYHKHQEKGSQEIVELDSMLEDMSSKAMSARRRFYSEWQSRFRKETPEKALTLSDQADWNLLNDHIALKLMDLENIESHKNNPTVVVELIGTALFQPLSAEYAPEELRLKHILARVKQIPRLLKQVESYLKASVPVYIDTAIEENQGNITLIEKTLAEKVKSYPELKAEYEEVAPKAVDALKSFSSGLKRMNNKGNQDKKKTWRLGKELYDRKFKLVMQTDTSPTMLLHEAKRELASIRALMMQIAVPMHMEFYPDHNHIKEKGKERENLIISEVLEKIAEDHVEPGQLIEAVRSDLDGITQFIKENKIVSLSPRNNLKVIPTPLFMRGIYSVAGFHSAPPLEPNGQAEYWVTPISKNMPREKAESKLKEYNNYTLKWLTIHEALPGHYIQFEHLNDIEPERRRLLRSLYANGPYVEGWAEYIAQVMLDRGYMTGCREFRMTMHKIRLRLLANAILDIKMHTSEMSDEEALKLMVDEAFQTRAEAEGKLRRVKLSSCQLPTYYVGLKEWQAFREDYQKTAGDSFNLLEFHDRALDEGPLPIKFVRQLVRPKAE